MVIQLNGCLVRYNNLREISVEGLGENEGDLNDNRMKYGRIM